MRHTLSYQKKILAQKHYEQEQRANALKGYGYQTQINNDLFKKDMIEDIIVCDVGKSPEKSLLQTKRQYVS